MRTDVYPAISGATVGWLTTAQIVDVDRQMVDDLRIGLLQMMENAGRNLARLTIDLAAPDRVAVICGPGGNGGGGMVAARHLANAGVDVVVTSSRPAAELSGVPARQYDILRRMGVETSQRVVAADVTVDALLGYSLHGAPRGRVADLIAQLPAAAVIALDTPSGLDVTAGTAPGSVVAADATMTLALPKIGLRAAPQVGALYLADISVPRSITARYGPSPPDFSQSSIVVVT